MGVAMAKSAAALVIRGKQKQHITLQDLGTVAKKFQEADSFWR